MQFNRFSPLPLILSIAAPLLGQQTTATLVGTITDSSSSSLVRTQVSVRNLQTNLTRETQTDDTGNYTVPFLPVGSYAVIAKMKGFRQAKVESVLLVAGQTGRVDFRTEIGDATQTMEVQATAIAQQTENATVGTTINSAKIVELPSNGRNFVQLA